MTPTKSFLALTPDLTTRQICCVCLAVRHIWVVVVVVVCCHMLVWLVVVEFVVLVYV